MRLKNWFLVFLAALAATYTLLLFRSDVRLHNSSTTDAIHSSSETSHEVLKNDVSVQRKVLELETRLTETQRNLEQLQQEHETAIANRDYQIRIAMENLQKAHSKIGTNEKALKEAKSRIDQLQHAQAMQTTVSVANANGTQESMTVLENCHKHVRTSLLSFAADPNYWDGRDIYYELSPEEFQNQQIEEDKLQAIADTFFEQGVVAIKNVVDVELARTLNKTTTELFYRLYALFEKRLAEGRGHIYNEMARRSVGRFDVNYGFDTPEWQQLDEHPVISQVIGQLLMSKHDNTKRQWSGVVMCTSQCQTQRWHVDGDDVHIDRNGNRIPGLPPHIVNVFVPLIDIREDTGPSTWYRGSQRDPWGFSKLPEEWQERQKVTVFAPLGSIILFDYRTLHRGEFNSGKLDRPMKYYSYSMSWFTDTINFPVANSLFDDMTEVPDPATNTEE